MLERLLLDGDVNAYVKKYLEAIGFEVVLATQVEVDVTDDVEVLKWARRHRRILVCHDKYRDARTRLRIYPEIYYHGGRVIRIGGGSDQPPLESFGKIVVHRPHWLRFFLDNESGIALVHQTGWKPMSRDYLHDQYQARISVPGDPIPALETRPLRRRYTPRRPRVVSEEQLLIGI